MERQTAGSENTFVIRRTGRCGIFKCQERRNFYQGNESWYEGTKRGWLYRKSAADHIRRIQSEFPDAQQRQAVLRAQGGVSLGAVLLCMLLLMVGGSAFTLLLGPDLQALLTALAG